MKFDCDSREERRYARQKARQRAIREWHPFFASLPIRVAKYDCRWMETIERRWVDNDWDDGWWEYRAK